MYLVSFNEYEYAQKFVDFMATKNILLHIETDQQGYYQLFLDEDNQDKITQTKHELAQYIKNPNNPRYLDTIWQNSHMNTRDMQRKLSLTLPKLLTAGLVTTTITLVCIGIYLLLLIVGPLIVFNYLGYPVFNHYNELWRYLTPIFIHFSLLHIIFNLMWWWYLGGMIERLKGRFKLIEIVIVAGIFSNYAQASINGPYFGGLSGVVYALMAYVWLYGLRRPTSGLHFEHSMIVIAIIWLIAGYTGILGPIANTAHLVGLIVGLILAAKDIWLLKGRR